MSEICHFSNRQIIHMTGADLNLANIIRLAKSSVASKAATFEHSKNSALNLVRNDQGSNQREGVVDRLRNLVMWIWSCEVAGIIKQKLEILNVNRISLLGKDPLDEEVQKAVDWLGALSRLSDQDEISKLLNTFAKFHRPRSFSPTRQMHVYAGTKNGTLLNPQEVVNCINTEARSLGLNWDWLNEVFSRNTSYDRLWEEASFDRRQQPQPPDVLVRPPEHLVEPVPPPPLPYPPGPYYPDTFGPVGNVVYQSVGGLTTVAPPGPHAFGPNEVAPKIDYPRYSPDPALFKSTKPDDGSPA
jgi:hypothetical protein